MKKTIVLTAAALFLAVYAGGVFAQTMAPKLPAPGQAPAGSPVAKHGQLSVSGKVIKDKDNNDVVLRGLSFFWSSAGEGYGGQYYTDDVVGWLVHDWKVSVFRAAMSVEADGGGGGGIGYMADSAGQSRAVRAVIDAAIRRGAYVIVDWHSHKAQNTTAAAQRFFTGIARDYGAYPNIIYETFNEPDGVSWDQIISYTNSVITSIRAIDNKNIITIGSPGWSSEPNGGSGVTNKANTVYTMHFYAASHPWGGGYGNNVTSALNAGRAVLVTEFGTCNYDGDGQVNTGNTDTWLSNLETNKVGWVNWSITSKKESASIFTQGGTGRAANAANWSPSSSPALSTSGTYIKGKITSANSSYYPTTTYAINATAGEGGKVTKNPDKASYTFGEKVTITAVPDAGYEFGQWEGDATGIGATISNYRVVGVNVSPKAVFLPSSMIKNGSFLTSIANWRATGTGLTISHDDGALKAVTTSAVASNAAVEQSNNPISLTGGKKYELTFRAKTSSGTATITPRVTNGNMNRDYLTPEPVALTSSWQTFTRTFDMCSRNSSGALINDASAAFFIVCGGNGAATWYLDDVVMSEKGDVTTCPSTPVSWSVQGNGVTKWSAVKAGGAWRLSGPSANAGAMAYIYDTRGRVVRSMAATDGLTVGAGIPAGSYFLVVKNRAGAEAYRSKITLVR